jgi:transcriptional regulator with XRE-family HTH domain
LRESLDPQLVRLGRRLRTLRQERRLTQDEVASRARFESGGKYVSEVELGKRSLPFVTLVTIVEQGLGTTLETVFSGMAGSKRRQVVEEPLPQSVLDAAYKIASLSPAKRTRVLAAIREIIAVASSD